MRDKEKDWQDLVPSPNVHKGRGWVKAGSWGMWAGYVDGRNPVNCCLLGPALAGNWSWELELRIETKPSHGRGVCFLAAGLKLHSNWCHFESGTWASRIWVSSRGSGTSPLYIWTQKANCMFSEHFCFLGPVVGLSCLSVLTTGIGVTMLLLSLLFCRHQQHCCRVDS